MAPKVSDGVLQVSPSSLADYAKCPLCYWLERTQGVKWPRGAFPSLPGGMDRVLKTYYDEWRGRGALPPELVANGVSGLLFDKQELLNEWRNLRKGLVTMVNGVRLKGQLDDLLMFPEGTLGVLDYKTRGSAPKEGGTELYYQVQADCYRLLVASLGYKMSAEARFAYYFPLSVDVKSGMGCMVATAFECQVVTISADADRAVRLIDACRKDFSTGTPPKSSPTCEKCAYIGQRTGTLGVHRGGA